MDVTGITGCLLPPPAWFVLTSFVALGVAGFALATWRTWTVVAMTMAIGLWFAWSVADCAGTGETITGVIAATVLLLMGAVRGRRRHSNRKEAV